MRIDSQAQTTAQSRQTPRLQRSAAAVIAQYIQDLTHPREAEPEAPVA
jgi:hypothetical protein